MLLTTQPKFVFDDGTVADYGHWIKTPKSQNHSIEHHGIVTGGYIDPATGNLVLTVTHNTPEHNVHVSSYSDFHNGRSVEVVRKPRDMDHQLLILQTAEENLGKPYALYQNCEDFTSFCYDHKSESPQRDKGLLAVGLGLVVATIFLSGND